MYFEELTLHNFGIYRGRHTLDLSVEPEKPIVLIGALNGGGKTTILDALQLALHGKFARCSNRGTLGYEAFLKKAINRYSDPSEGAAVELEFTRYAANRAETIRIIRTWRQAGNAVKEQLEVTRDGKHDPVYSENWYEHVDEFIPTRLAELFFFDGEKIEYFADPNNASELIRSGLDALLGLDTVSQLKKDLDVVAQRRIKSAGNKNANAHVDQVRAELSHLEGMREQLIRRRAVSQKDLDVVEKEVSKLTAHFQSIGGDLYERQSELEEEKQAADKAVEATSQALRELAAGGLPLLLVEQQLRDCQEQAAEEEKAQRDGAILSVLQERDETLTAYLESISIDQDTLAAIQDFITSDRTQRAERTNTEVTIGIPYSELAKYDQEYFDQLRNAARDALAAHEAAAERQTRATRTLTGLPQTEDVRLVSRDLADKKDARESLLVEIATTKEQIEKVQRQIEEMEGKISSLMGDKALMDFADETAQRILAQRETAQTILGQFNDRLRARHINQLETLLLESLKLLYRKERLVTGVTIHPRTLELTLKDQEGGPITPDRLSAGERQLLAVGLVWSVAKASTSALPTVIDTPLGRLDSLHRRTLVENYFPMASHQSLLLSTDEEITGDLYSALAPRTSKAVTIQYSEERATSHIETGYFGA